jgi:hypothetical protein
MDSYPPEPTLEPTPRLAESNPSGCGGFLTWMAAAFVLPVFSPTFYQRAARSRLVYAMTFFFLFALVISLVQSLAVLRSLSQVRQEIVQAYAGGNFPIIRIQAGEAIVEGPQTYVILDADRTLAMIDTSGAVTEIDRSRYDQGVLLTRRSLIFLSNSGDYRKVPLRDLQMAMEMDPIVLDQENVLSLWTYFGGLVSVAALLGLLLWNTLARLSMLLTVGLVVWGFTTILRRSTGFGEVLSAGIYAVVPAVYASALLERLTVSFLGMFTLITCLFWFAGLFFVLYPRQEFSSLSPWQTYAASARPLRAWRAWLGVPLLAVLAYEAIFGWGLWFVSWAVAILVLGLLLGVSLVPLLNPKEAPAEAARNY